ncbi:serine racemase VanT catalytic subunit [Anaerolentibacter hominis]|uniref:serine racemase VanT catalytic subunit n=1 Tax=Anaerolentibacter hominis TaxID=3079009 RepID=UPI0031B8362C
MKGRVWTELDMNHLKHNVEWFRENLSSNTEIMAVVKANAYGHGDVSIARELNRQGVRAFAVATAGEGVWLRENKVKGDILVLGFSCREEFADLCRCNLIQTVIDEEYAEELNSFGREIRVHIKIDTGMHRLGEDYQNLDGIKKIYACSNLRVEGLYTHLSVADSQDPGDIDFTRGQIRHFHEIVQELREQGYPTGKLHIQSSYGVLNYPELKCHYARIGIALYGVLSSGKDHTRLKAELEPVLSLRARIAAVREVRPGESVGYGRDFIAPDWMRIAVVTIGYGDGYPRNLSNGRGHVLLHGELVPVIGRICMDQLMIDVTHVTDVAAGDVVTLIGRDHGKEIRAEQVAAWSGTISNEILCRLNYREE